jgi:hypothetical protein
MPGSKIDGLRLGVYVHTKAYDAYRDDREIVPSPGAGF